MGNHQCLQSPSLSSTTWKTSSPIAREVPKSTLEGIPGQDQIEQRLQRAFAAVFGGTDPTARAGQAQSGKTIQSRSSARGLPVRFDLSGISHIRHTYFRTTTARRNLNQLSVSLIILTLLSNHNKFLLGADKLRCPSTCWRCTYETLLRFIQLLLILF